MSTVVIIIVGLFIIGIIVGSIILVVFLVTKNRKSKTIQVNKTSEKKSLGETLKAHRTRCNMTQEFVAETMGVTRQAVSKWEKGDSDPSTSNLLALAKVFGVSAEELLKAVE